MDPVTENVQIAFRRRARKVVVVSPFGVDHCVSTENIQASVSRLDQKSAIEVSRRQVKELEENAKLYEHLASRDDAAAVGIAVDESLRKSDPSNVDWEVGKFYPSTERLQGRSSKTKSEVVTVEPDVLMALEEASLIRLGLAGDEHLKERSGDLPLTDDTGSPDHQGASDFVDFASSQKSSTNVEEDVQQEAFDAGSGIDLSQVQTTYDNTHSTLHDDDKSNVSVSSSLDRLHPGIQLPSVSGTVTDSRDYGKSLDDVTGVDQTKPLISVDVERESFDKDSRSKGVVDVSETTLGDRSGVPSESFADESQTVRPFDEAYLTRDDKKSVDYWDIDRDASNQSLDEKSFISKSGDRVSGGPSEPAEEGHGTVETDNIKTKYVDETRSTSENKQVSDRGPGEHTERLSFDDEDEKAESKKGDRIRLGDEFTGRDSLDLDVQRQLGQADSSVKSLAEKEASVSQDQKAAEFEGFGTESFVLDDQKSESYGVVDFEEQSLGDRGVISSKHRKPDKGTSVAPEDQGAAESGVVPSKFMQGAFLGLDSEGKADDQKGHDKKQEKKKKKKKGNLYPEEDMEGEVQRVTITVEETLVDEEGHARDSATKPELSHGLVSTEDDDFGAKTVEKDETLHQHDWKATEFGDKAESLISDSQTFADWGNVEDKYLEKSSTDLTEQKLADQKAASGASLSEKDSLLYQRAKGHEDISAEFYDEASITLDDKTPTDRGIISGKTVEKGTGEGGYGRPTFTEDALLSSDYSRGIDVDDKSLAGRDITTVPLEEVVETRDGSSGLSKGTSPLSQDDERAGHGETPAGGLEGRSSERGDVHTKSTEGAFISLEDQGKTDWGEFPKGGEFRTQDDHRSAERGDIRTKSLEEESLALDESGLGDHGVISGKSIQVGSELQKEKGIDDAGYVPSKFMEGALLNIGDQKKPDQTDRVAGSLDGKFSTLSDDETSHHASIPTKSGSPGESVQQPAASVGEALFKLNDGASTDRDVLSSKDAGKASLVQEDQDAAQHGDRNRPQYTEHGRLVIGGQRGAEDEEISEDALERAAASVLLDDEIIDRGRGGGTSQEAKEDRRAGVPTDLVEDTSGLSADWNLADLGTESLVRGPNVDPVQHGRAEHGPTSEESVGEGRRPNREDQGAVERGDIPEKVLKEAYTLDDNMTADRGFVSGKSAEIDLSRYRGRPSQSVEEDGGDQKRYDRKDSELESNETRDIWLDRGDVKAKSVEGLDVEQEWPTDHGVISGRLNEGASYSSLDKITSDRRDDKTKSVEGIDLAHEWPTDRGVVSGRLPEGASFVPSDGKALDRGVDKTKSIEGFDVEGEFHRDRGVTSGRFPEGSSFVYSDGKALDRGDDKTKSIEGFDVDGEFTKDRGVTSGRFPEGSSFVSSDGKALDRGDDKTKSIEGFDVEGEFTNDRGIVSGRFPEGSSFLPLDDKALDRGDDKTKSIEGFDVEGEFTKDRGIVSGRLPEGSSFVPSDGKALDRGDDKTKSIKGFDVEQDWPTDRGVISGRLPEGASFVPTGETGSKSGYVPPTFMEGAYLGLDKHRDDEVAEGLGEKDDLETPDGGSQSLFGKKKDKKDKKKKKKKGGAQQLEEPEDETEINPTKERTFPVSEPLPSVDSRGLVTESGKDGAIRDIDQLQVSSVPAPNEELQEQKRQKEVEETKRLQELEEQKKLQELERQRYLQELEDEERLQELEEQKRLQELEKKRLEELEEQRRLQELKEQKRVKELEEQKRLKELEEQKRAQELEEQKRVQELEEQKRLQELEEQKRLELLEQRRLEKIKELQDEKRASCLPYAEQLDQLGQRLANISKHLSQLEKSEERMVQLEELQKDLKELETRLLALKNEWNDVTLDDGADDPISAALSNLQTLKKEVGKCSDDLQGVMDERREKQDELSKITKRFDVVQLWFLSAKASALGKPIHTTSVKFQQEQLCDISNISEELDAKLQELKDIKDQLHSLPECEDLKAESRIEEKLDGLKNDISNLKGSLAERLKNLKKESEKNEKRQKELQNLESSLVDIQKKVSQMLRSSDLPTEDDLETWKQMPKPGKELQQMLQAEIQEQRELVKTVSDDHVTLKAAPPETRANLPETSSYTPLPLAVVTREPGSSRVLEAAVQKKVADLRKYWQKLRKDSNAGLEEYQSGQRKFGDVMSTAYQWLDCIEGEAARPTSAAELQDLHRQTTLFRLIYGELLELQNISGETGQSLKDKLPVSSAQQSALLAKLLEDLDRRLVLLEEEERCKELQAVERKAWQINLQNQLADVEKEVRNYEKQYLTLSDRKIPCETRLMAAKQLDDDCKESIQRLDALRAEVELRFIQDPAVSIPPELFSIRHHLIDLHDKVAERKVDLSRATNSNVQYETLLEQYAEFLETAHEKVKPTMPSVSDLSQLKDELSMHKGFFQDLVSHQTLVETIGLKVDPQEKERYHSSHARLNSLALAVLDKANGQQLKLKQAVDQWSEVGPQLKEKTAWLENVERRLPRPTSETESMEALERRIHDLQAVQKELEVENGSVFQVVESGRQLLKLVACPAFSRKLDDFVDRHQKVNNEVAEELKSLEALVKLSKQFDSDADKVEQWMKSADAQKDSINKLLSKDVKQAEDGLLELKRDCEDCQSHRTSAITLGNKLLRSRPSDTRVRNKLKLISDDWMLLMNDIADIEARVQDAQRAQLPSRQALSELLQWLQTVRQSIAQDGATRPRNREDAQQLLKKYKLLKGDLTNRQLNIDYVNKVAEQSQSDKQASHMDQALSAEQLGEMNKQYQGLCSEVNNKMIKLEMVCDAWKEYESTVECLRDWLESESAQISREEQNVKGTIVDPTLKNCKDAADALKIRKEKDLESVKRLGSGLVKSSDWPANAESINNVLDGLNKQCALVEDKLNRLQQLAMDRKRLTDDYDLALKGVNDVIDRTQSSLNKLQQTSGCDIASLKDQVVQLQTLQKEFDGTKEVLKKLSGATDALVSDLDPASRKTVQDGQKKAVDRWQKLKEQISEQLSSLQTLSSNWSTYNDEYSNAVSWLSKKESEIERLLQNDLRDDKEGQLRNLTAKQQELVAFKSKLSELENLSKELLPSLDNARVVHIVSSQTSLNQQVDTLQQSIERRLQSLSAVEGNRENIVELCEKVEAFLKEAKDGLTKSNVPYNSSDPEVVQDRLRSIRNLSDEFSQMNPCFAELNRTGYRLPLSRTDSDRLKNVNDRWHELHSETNKQHKKLQQQLLLLQSFADKCDEWNSFLADVEVDLTGDICGNYDSVLEQQQKLEAFQQDIFPHQQILYSIISDGHEMMENSRGTGGAEDFGRKLQLLEEQWQTIVRQANQRKVLVDNIVTLWQTYRGMIDELSATVGRVRKFVDGHPVVPETFSSVRHHLDDYTDIRNQLNATKPIIDKLQSYSLLLSPNSDSATIGQLQSDVKLLDDEARKLSVAIDSNIKQLGNTLTLWETTQSNLDSFVAWLKEIKTFLTPGVPNKYNALVNELEKLENLQSDKSDRCDELTKNLESLTAFITPEDSLILCQRLRLLTQQQSEVSRQIADRRQLVRDRLNRWAEFDKKSDDLLSSFANVEQKIHSLDALSIEDAIAEIENDLQLEIATLEKRKVELTGLGNELKRNSQDLRASDIEHKISAMNDKCSRLKEMLNERLNKLTVALGTLQQLERKIQDLRRWLLDVEHHLTRPIVYETCSNAEIQLQLRKQLTVQKDIDDHNLPVISVINLCETLSSDKIACPSPVEAQAIRQARDKLESRWKKINVGSTERKKVIEETGQLWQKFNSAHQDFTVWLKTIERQVLNPRTGGATFKAMKEEKANIQQLQVDIQAKLSDLDLLNRLYCRLAHEGRTDGKKMLKKKIDDANVRWDNLLATAEAVVKRISHIIRIKEDFEANRLALVIWLSSLSDVLTELDQLDGPPSAKILNSVRKELASNSARMDYTDRASSFLTQKCEPSDAVHIQRHMDEFHTIHENVLRQLRRLEDRLRLAGGPEDATEDVKCREKIRQLETQLEGSRKDISSSEIDDAVGRLDVNIDDVWDNSHWKATRPDWEEGLGSRATGSYALSGDESLLVELSSLEEWLLDANATLDSERKAPQDMAQFDRCVKKHQDLNDQIESWRSRVFRIQSALSPIAHHTLFTEDLCNRISTAVADWDRVCLRTSDWFARLQRRLEQSEEFQMSIEDVGLWVEDVRVDLDSLDMEKPADSSTPLSVVEAKRRKLTVVEHDLKDIRDNLNFIRDIAEYFLQDSTSDAAADDFDQLDRITDDLGAMQIAYNNHLTMLEGVRGKSFERSSLTSGEGYLSRSTTVFPLGTSGRRIPRYAHSSAGKQKPRRKKSPNEGAADAATRDDEESPSSSYVGVLKRACRTAIPIQLMMLLLIGVASLVPMCENECILNALDPILKYADGSPPL